MGNCLIKKHGFIKTKFSDIHIQKIGTTWPSNFSLTSEIAGTYVITGSGSSMSSPTVSNGGRLLYSDVNRHWCVVAELPMGATLTMTNASNSFVGMIPVTHAEIIQVAKTDKANATARTTLTDQPANSLFIGAATYTWQSCASGSARGCRAGGTDIKLTGYANDGTSVIDGTSLTSGWNDAYGTWGNEMVVNITPTSNTNTLWVEGYLASPDHSNHCASWLFQIAKKI